MFQVYKKKTEAAKKEYLKALAAYRASLVSKGSENDQHQQQQQIQYGAYSGGYAATGPANNVAYQVYSPQAQPSSPQQHQQMNIKKSPHLTQIHNNTQQQQSVIDTVNSFKQFKTKKFNTFEICEIK